MRLLKAILRFAHGRTLALSILGGVLAGVASTGLLLVVNSALYYAEPAREPRLLWGFVGLVLVATALRIASAEILQRLGARMACELQVQLSRQILRAPLRRLEKQGPARLLVALTTDIESISAALRLIPAVVVSGAVVVSCLGYVALSSWRILMVVVPFFVIGVGTVYAVMNVGGRRQQVERDKQDELFHHFRGVTHGVLELKMRRQRRRDFLALLNATAGQLRDLRIAAMRIFVVAADWGNLLFFSLIGILVFWGPTVSALERPAISGAIIVLLYMISPLELLLISVPFLSRAHVALDKIERLGISLLEDGPGTERQDEAAPRWCRLDLVAVEHTYHHAELDSDFTLGPIHLTLRPGELVFVTGGNGSGKTTLAKVLLGLYPPERGEIRLDGEMIEDRNRQHYRHHFSVVFSDFYLFESFLGLDSSDLDERARRYLKRLELDRKVQVENGRLSTIDLSHGQRKRLALLTAFLEDRPVYVFDEWAAEQDPDFKRVFYEALLPELLARDKTIVAISHDDAYYGVGGRLIKLDSGRLVSDRPAAETPLASNESRRVSADAADVRDVVN